MNATLPSLKGEISRIYGTELIASMINAPMYGLGMAMSLHYCKLHWNNDTIRIKGTVILLMACATIETLGVSSEMYHYLAVIHDVTRLDLEDIWYFSISCFFGKYLGAFLTAFVAQIFYASRIWICEESQKFHTSVVDLDVSVTDNMTRKWRFLPLLIVTLAFVQLGTGLVQGIYLQGTFPKLITVQAVFTAHFGNQNVHTSSLLNKFIFYAINRAAATSICALLDIFLYDPIVGKHTLIKDLKPRQYTSYQLSVLKLRWVPTDRVDRHSLGKKIHK
ncbi:hypothetical protein BDQ17DRAFT_1329283 [Cyathus striatus]|nr:hypothetical protein BDQ17DRAFT_1329283 [Cyathus striatus]